MLDGVNKVCAQCKKACKQFEQVTLINCPNFEPLTKAETSKVT